LYGNIREPGNAGTSLWKSSLFFLASTSEPLQTAAEQAAPKPVVPVYTLYDYAQEHT
jgi:FKBP-type peptidyl-prolyl cis-trans isomerase